MKDEKRFHCDKCSRNFASEPGLKRHKTRTHKPAPSLPPPPLPAPKKSVQRAVNDRPETFRLASGAYLDVGDVFWHVRKFVIKKITKTAGDSTVEVEAECTKRSWQKENYGI